MKPPKIASVGPVRWMQENLFSSPLNTILTILAVLIVYGVLAPLIDWALVRGVFEGSDATPCRTETAGACWPAITERLGTIFYGKYPLEERWRPALVGLLGVGGLAWLMVPHVPAKGLAMLLMLTVYPVLAALLLLGGVAGLAPVSTQDWGGLLLTLVIAATSITLSFPLGVLLALGRRSDLPAVRWVSTAFIEFWRGVPLITVLFLAGVLLPLFVPGGQSVDHLVRALAGFVIFSSAYVAEAVRGGLQAVPPGQVEAAKAIGLGYWGATSLIVLPQALRLSIPSLVNTFCGIIKDTSLVAIIAFVDLLGQVQKIGQDAEWASPNTSATGYLFAGAIFWALCFGLSRYARHWERKLGSAQGR